jgi:hypothetical protein
VPCRTGSSSCSSGSPSWGAGSTGWPRPLCDSRAAPAWTWGQFFKTRDQVYFQTKYPNLGVFWRALFYDRLE